MNALSGLDISLRGLGMTDQECCATVRYDCGGNDHGKAGGDRGGSIVWCNGRVIPCAWHTNANEDAQTIALKTRATMVHEGSHAREASGNGCGKDAVYAGVPAEDIYGSECRAYSAELPVLQQAMQECVSEQCRHSIEAQIKASTGYYSFSNGNQVWSPTPTGRPNEWGNWRGEFCKKAGMSIPTAAQATAQSLAIARTRSTAPWRDTAGGEAAPEPARKKAPAPTIEYDNAPATPVRAAPHPAPTIEYGTDRAEVVSVPQGDDFAPSAPAAALPLKAASGEFNMQSCPRGMQFVILDGKPSCKGPNGFEPWSAGMRGLADLSDLGATKKKKAVKKQPKAPTQAAKPAATPSKSSESFASIAASVVAPVAVGGVTYAATKNPWLALAAGAGALLIARGFAKKQDFYGTIGPKIKGTNDVIVNY